LTNNSRSFFFSFSSSTSLVTETFAKIVGVSTSSLVGGFESLFAVFLLKIKSCSFLENKSFFISYFSASSALVLSILVVGRSIAVGPRALINCGRALVFPPAAVIVAAEVPFSLPLVDAAPFAAVNAFVPPFFGFFLKRKLSNDKGVQSVFTVLRLL
jgi:hypothetical protein